jgi:serine/threonine-protein kinase HipA
MDLLLGVRGDLRESALRFRDGEGPFLADVTTDVPALTDLPDLPDLQRLIRVGSSLAATRPKAHIRHPDGRVAIAEFPSADQDTWNVMAWEEVALDLAAAAGIDVPHTDLLNLAGRHVLCVRPQPEHRPLS